MKVQMTMFTITKLILCLALTSCSKSIDYKALAKSKIKPEDIKDYKTDAARKMCLTGDIKGRKEILTHCLRTLASYTNSLKSPFDKNSIDLADKACSLGEWHICAKTSLYYLKIESLEKAYTNLSVGCDNYHFLSCELLFMNLKKLNKFIKNDEETIKLIHENACTSKTSNPAENTLISKYCFRFGIDLLLSQSRDPEDYKIAIVAFEKSCNKHLSGANSKEAINHDYHNGCIALNLLDPNRSSKEIDYDKYYRTYLGEKKNVETMLGFLDAHLGSSNTYEIAAVVIRVKKLGSKEQINKAKELLNKTPLGKLILKNLFLNK